MLVRSRISRHTKAEGGFTLPELLIATMIGLVVIGSAVTFFTAAIRGEPRVRDRSAQIQQARVMAERISRELRQGSNASSPNPSQLMILTYVPRASCGDPTPGAAIRCRIFYSCDTAGACTRTECGPNTVAPPTGCGTSVEVVEGLLDNQVFAFTPRIPGQAFVSVRLAFPATDGEDAITVEDGVALRNPPLGGP
ncbi:MAG TPA: prepilin-type N-terminal cleavage/methylation domain-containing protein [Solirubrobacterales bacterium]|jgi:prepilin-type N-terminal cleavage/methylation domain-containing protein|nr:prepilin-type N-terminal cleavage/methylation domain-containing protein [Solirubrobacterales bacterium]